MMHSMKANPITSACMVGALMLSVSCLGQDRGKITLTDEELLGLCGQRESHDVIHSAAIDLELERFNPNWLAVSLPDGLGTVVDGEFYGIPEPREGELESLDREQVSFNFRVDKVYKGSAPDTIRVEAVSDMLAFPGKNTTRYAERMRILELQRATMRPVSDQLKALRKSFDTGQITEESYLTQLGPIFRLMEDTAAAHDFKVTDHTEVTPPIHGTTYYDLGEGIRENKPFLIYFQTEVNEADTQVLDEVWTIIYSGEWREDVIEAMTSPEGIVLPHPFRGYDPTDDRDCATLRELVGAPKPPPQPSEVARRLLDEFELVALGEFIDIPETDGEELRGHASDAVRMISVDLPISLRIDKLYKGEAPAVLELVLNSDMLEFPGSGVSRYVHRGRIFDELSRLDEDWVEARWRFSEEDIGVSVMDVRQALANDPDYLEKEDKYLEKETEYFESIGGMPDWRKVYTYFADTFYDRGGVIRPYDRYLVAINRDKDTLGLWRVSDTAEESSRIYWGDEAAELIRQLDALVP